MDLRTKIGRHHEIMEQVTQYRGFSVFWATENYLRACELMRMQEAGKLIVTPTRFPWSDARLT